MKIPQTHSSRAFTLVEVLLSMVILAMIMLIVTQVIGQAQSSWKKASSRVTQFRESRTAFDTLVRGLRQATLPDYYDWTYPGGATPATRTELPNGLGRSADLGFVSGAGPTLVQGAGGSDFIPGHAVVFQAPLGVSITAGGAGGEGLLYEPLKSLLNVRGYFIKFGSDADYVPVALAGRLKQKNRYRLFEYRPPTEENSAFDPSVADGTWARIENNPNYLMPVAENIVTLAFGLSFAAPAGTAVPDLARPASSASSSVPFFSSYNSYEGTSTGGAGNTAKHHLPRAVQVIMVAIDEESASKLEEEYGTSPPGLLVRSGATFTSTAAYDSDLDRLQKVMQEKRLNYRIFSSIVLVPGSKT